MNLRGVLALIAPAIAQQAPSAPLTPPPAREEIVALSPFAVNTTYSF